MKGKTEPPGPFPREGDPHFASQEDIMKRKTIQERYEEKISMEPMTGCWFWTGSEKKGEYSQSPENGRKIRGHRFSWKLYRGPVPDGLYVLHHCDTPQCVSPYHLFLGSGAEHRRSGKRV